MDNTASTSSSHQILAFVGMPGAGKSEAIAYIERKGIPFLRFGQITDEGVQALGLPLIPENERKVREQLREELGMAAYAIKSKPKLDALLKDHEVIAVDGLYSWEEYTYLKKDFPNLILIDIYAEPQVRYARLAKRPIRPVPVEKSRVRDIAEIEKLNKGGPIAIADHLLENNGEHIEELYQKIDILFERLHIKTND